MSKCRGTRSVANSIMVAIGDRLGVARDATLLATCKAMHSEEDLLILQHLDSIEEEVLFSLEVVKKNKRGYKQNRALVVTTLAIYNFAVNVCHSLLHSANASPFCSTHFASYLYAREVLLQGQASHQSCQPGKGLHQRRESKCNCDQSLPSAILLKTHEPFTVSRTSLYCTFPVNMTITSFLRRGI